MTRRVYPFTAIVGQERMKMALILNTIHPRIGGVLIQGEKGSAKSTAVRALQMLLPQIQIVEGCALHCDPQDLEHLCQDCQGKQKNAALPGVSQQVPFVNLPIGATEDRLLGTLNIEEVIQKGQQRFQPGLLANAHRGILYIDEVNLLNDHLVDAMLDAAAMGVNVVERDGISMQHPSSFILVGTMNPEEGELRAQLLDRFALAVDAERMDDIAMRCDVVARRIAFEKDPEAFLKEWEYKEQVERNKITNAQTLLPRVKLSSESLLKIATLCKEAGVDGLRADIIIHKTATALAAYHGRTEVTDEDIQEAAELALIHRQRPQSPAPKSPPPPQKKDSRNNQQQEGQAGIAPEKIFAPSDAFKVKDWSSNDMVRAQKAPLASAQGRRVSVQESSGTGPVVGWRLPKDSARSIHWNATIRQAAQRTPRAIEEGNLALQICSEDVRENVREKLLPHLIVFVVDASGSMGAAQRMEQTKGAILSLLRDSYQKRDQVAMIAFRGEEAKILLPPTRGIERALRCLKELPVGGRTPLIAGLRKTMDLLKPITQGKDAKFVPLVVLITDGRANAFSGSESPQEEIAAHGKEFLRRKIRVLVIDTEEGFVRMGMAQRLGLALGAKTIAVGSLRAESLAATVKANLEI